jgi:hypothetical protein
MKPTITAIKDASGSIILGELAGETANDIQLTNPATLFIQPTQNGQLNVQLFPMIFGELLSAESKKKGTVWSFAKASNAVATSIELDEKLISQYTRIFNPSPIITPNSGEVIKLFDD